MKSELHTIWRNMGETLFEFHTRVANEIKTINGRIINAYIGEKFAVLEIEGG